MVLEMTATSSVTLVTLDNSRRQVTELLEAASIPYREDSSSNISGTTITKFIIPIAAIVVPVFVDIILELRESSSQTIVNVHNTTINILCDDNVEQNLKDALEAVKAHDSATIIEEGRSTKAEDSANEKNSPPRI
jgi:hypothetical protein